MHTAVEIFAVIKTPGKPDEMLIVRQFRPPLMKDLLELPAGLVDAGESCSQAAIRELKEETGSVQTLLECSDGNSFVWSLQELAEASLCDTDLVTIGYSGKVVYESEIVTADPGLTDATFRLVHVEVLVSAVTARP